MPFQKWQTLINPELRRGAATFLLAYGLLLAAGQLMNRQTIAAFLIFGLTAIELITFDRITVSHRKTISKGELSARIGYNDETVDAVRDIKAGDDSFFRITKLRPSGLSDSPSLARACEAAAPSARSTSSFLAASVTTRTSESPVEHFKVSSVPP